MHSKVAKITQRFNKAKSIRVVINVTLQEIGEFVVMEQGNFARKVSIPRIDTLRIFDTTANDAWKKITSTLQTGLTNNASRWFSPHFLGLDQKTRESDIVQRYQQNVADVMLEMLNGSYSGFSASNYEWIGSQTSYGTGIMHLDYDKDDKCLTFNTIHFSKMYFLEGKRNRIDTVYKEDEFTIRQAVQEFGIENLHPSMQKLYDTDPDFKFTIVHEVKPRSDEAVGIYSGFKYISTYIDIDHYHIIEEKGMKRMPYIIGRLMRHPGDVYGRSWAWDVMPIVRMINTIERDTTRATQLKDMPPLLLSDDAVMQNLDIRPLGKIIGGIDPVTNQHRVQPMEVGGDHQGVAERIQRLEEQIKSQFCVSQMYFKDGTPVTATEDMHRQEADRRQISPASDRLQSESYDPLLRNVYEILQENGHFGELPAELQGKKIKFEYLSPLAMQNKMQDVLAIQRGLAPLAPFAGMAPELFATIFDSMDFPLMVKYGLKAAGVPATLFKTPEQYQADLAAKQKQQNIQQNAQLMGFAQQLGKPVQ